MAFDLSQYEPVAVRLARLLDTLRAKDLDPRIVTVMLSAPGADVCVFRAELWIGDSLMATGHAEEVRGNGHINRVSHVENCETSSLGRMCESYFPTPDLSKRPSREEMSKVQNTAPKMRIAQASSAKGDGVTIKGDQWGPIPDWLVLEAAQAGVTQVWDNRNQLAANPKRPWFKDVNGDKAFWAPKGTPLPVMATHEDDLDDSPEEPF
jgi:hypothetical protein